MIQFTKIQTNNSQQDNLPFPSPRADVQAPDSFEELSPKRGRDGLRHETCLRPFASPAGCTLVLLTQHRMLRISPTANGPQVPCRKSVDSSANSAVNGRDCARAAVKSRSSLAYFMSEQPNQPPIEYELIKLEEEADAALEAAREKFPGKFDNYHFSRVVMPKYADAITACKKAKDYDRLVRIYEKMAAIREREFQNPGHAEYWLVVDGDFLRSIQREDLAHQLYLKALSLCDGQIPDTLNQLANASENLKKQVLQGLPCADLMRKVEILKMHRIDDLIRKAELLAKLDQEPTTKISCYKEAADLLMEFENGFVDSSHLSGGEVNNFTLAALCYERAGIDSSELQQTYLKSIHFIEPYLTNAESELKKTILGLDLRVNEGPLSENEKFWFTMLLSGYVGDYYSLNHIALFCAAKLEEKGPITSLLEKEIACSYAFLDCQSRHSSLILSQPASPESNWYPQDILLCFQSRCLFDYELLASLHANTEKAAFYSNQALNYVEQLKKATSPEDWNKIVLLKNFFFSHHEKLMDLDEKALQEVIEKASHFPYIEELPI